MMVLKAWSHLSIFCRTPHQHPVATHNATFYLATFYLATFYLIQPKHSPKLDTFAQLTFTYTYDRCMRLEQADKLLRRTDGRTDAQTHRRSRRATHAWSFGL